MGEAGGVQLIVHHILLWQQVAREDMRGCVQELCPILMTMLQDSSSLAKREVALWTFGQLVENTGSEDM